VFSVLDLDQLIHCLTHWLGCPDQLITSTVLPTMPSSISNLSTDEQQATAAAKRKDDDVTAVVQGTATIAQ
jgi:hypothetical protein